MQLAGCSLRIRKCVPCSLARASDGLAGMIGWCGGARVVCVGFVLLDTRGWGGGDVLVLPAGGGVSGGLAT